MDGIAHFFSPDRNIWYQPFWTFADSLELSVLSIKLNLFNILFTKRDFVATLELHPESVSLTVVLLDVLCFPESHLSNPNTIKYYANARSNYARTDYSWSRCILHHVSGGQSPASRFRYPDTDRGQSMWDLCWRITGTGFSQGIWVPPPVLFN
jgi:hypothetical protein